MAHLISSDGALYTWGINEEEKGLLGLGPEIYVAKRPVPNKSLFEFRLIKISISSNHVCACDSKGKLFSWGTGRFGELGLEESQVHSP